MNNVIKILGITFLALTIGFSFLACDSSGGTVEDGREIGVYETVRNNVTFTLTISPPRKGQICLSNR